MPYKCKRQIGNCTLYLGDCTDILPEIGNVETVVADPPYGMSFLSNHRKVSHRAILNDDSKDALSWCCNIQADHSKYVFCRWDNLAEVPQPKSCVTWVKNNWSMGDLKHSHARQTELILHYPGKLHYFPGKRPSDVVNAPRTGNKSHPTEKPVALMSTIIGWTAGTVFDPFMGSGTTGVACVGLGRRFIGIEIDEEYFTTACERIEEETTRTRLFS